MATEKQRAALVRCCERVSCCPLGLVTPHLRRPDPNWLTEQGLSSYGLAWSVSSAWDTCTEESRLRSADLAIDAGIYRKRGRVHQAPREILRRARIVGASSMAPE